MRSLRLARRLVLTSCFTLACFLLLILGALVVRAAKGRPAARRYRARILTLWSRGMARLIGMRIRVLGRAPSAPFFLVTNHLSYVDVLLLASQAPCAFIGKSEIGGWPVMGTLSRAVGTLFIERASKRDIPRVIEDIETTLATGVGIVLFPEATSSRGAQVLPFRPALLEPAARAHAAVSYASLSYRTPDGEPSAEEAVCWWDEKPMGSHILALFQLPEFEASVIFGARTVRNEDRKALAEALHGAVVEQFEPVVRDAPIV